MNEHSKFSYYRNSLICASLITAGAFASAVTVANNEKPNVIVIMVDDLGFSGVSSYVGLIETPNLDNLASQGVRFSQFFNAARSCPARASLLTGLYPHEAGVGHMTLKVNTEKKQYTPEDRMYIPTAYRGWLVESVYTLPEMMKMGGYSTYMTGKWHISSPDSITWPLQRGFDKFYGVLPGTSDYFDPQELYNGNKHIKAQGENYYTTDAFTDEAIQFLKEHNQTKEDQPYFLYLAYNAPHFPMQAMPEDFEKYRGRFNEGWDVLRQRVYENQIASGIIPKNTVLAPLPCESKRLGNQGAAVPSWDSLIDTQKDRMDAIMATYAGLVDRVDQNVGKLITYLTETGQLENTLIFFFSDNGGEAEAKPLGNFNMEELGKYGLGGEKYAHYGKAWATFINTPFREHKHFMHQGGIASPLIVHWPKGIKKNINNTIISQYAFLQDITLTCMDVAGVEWAKRTNVLPWNEAKEYSVFPKGKYNL